MTPQWRHEVNVFISMSQFNVGHNSILVQYTVRLFEIIMFMYMSRQLNGIINDVMNFWAWVNIKLYKISVWCQSTVPVPDNYVLTLYMRRPL